MDDISSLKEISVSQEKSQEKIDGKSIENR